MFRNPTTDLIVVLVIVLLILGPKRLPGLGRSLGTGMREFKDSITGDSGQDDVAEERPVLPAAEPSPRSEAVPAAGGSSAGGPGPDATAGTGESGPVPAAEPGGPRKA